MFDAWNYQIDSWQRSVLFLDTLRQRADNMIEHEENGMPPLLDFKYEMVLDARTFDSPANYALLKITEIEDVCLKDCFDPEKPPVIIVDPRAGHGPGIGGFKRDSEVGIAMHEGYPVYFVMFYPDPEPHQTVSDVLQALRKFTEKAKKLHGGKAPILYGNCQAGWMLTILAADCEGLAGPVITNGSPLSYWASSEEGNPMQIMGSLAGGVWISRFLADLGNGTFDGAWLVQNFERLNPANALWEKYYNLYANIDTERDRFLEFERWWTGFYSLSEEEITTTVENLFVGNKLERGELVLDDGCTIDLKKITNPLLIFASHGDNITPPRQALHWIRQVYPTTADLKKAGQRIAYMINEHVGHLGIFVSAKVAKLEHRAMLEHVREMEYLKPGLYEMKIINPTNNPDCRHDQYEVQFEERQIEDLCESQPSEPFDAVRRISEQNDTLYRWTLRPWVQAFANPLTADMLKNTHPMRLSRKMFSKQLNPWMWHTAWLAKLVEDQRIDKANTTPEGTLYEAEQTASQQIAKALHDMSDARDKAMHGLFSQLYGGTR
ncbi:MAG: DUF3141 domain-containing protein [Alphaproteobacteria bacterium]|nr:DUF3141 domain-containing protein [Alphaproteobacteria bacterium]